VIDDIDILVDGDDSHHSAISPVARKIMMGADDDLFEDLEFGDDNNDSSTPRRKFPLDHSEYEEMISRNSSSDDGNRIGPNNRQHEGQHSLPSIEELKISLAAAARAAKASSFSSLPYQKTRTILCSVLIFLLAIIIIVVIAIVAVAAGKNRNKNQNSSSSIISSVNSSINSNSNSNSNSNNQDQNTYGIEDLDDGHGGTSIVFASKGTAVGTYDDRVTHLQNYFVLYGVTKTEQYWDDRTSEMNTPQSKAIAWLAIRDKQFPVLPTHNQGLDTPEGYKLVMRYAMAVLYFATGGPHWNIDMNFMSPELSTCDWFHVFPPPMGQVGVLCNQNTQQIVGLSLISNNLVGTLPTEISQLTSITYLESIENKLGGTIPNEWQNLQNLTTLIMGFSQLTGTLPSWMPQAWPQLKTMYLSNNELTGTIPEDFSAFQQLSIMALDDNLLTGRVDVVWNSLQSLEYLYLEDNDFTGTLPNLMAEFNPALVNLDISSNLFNGGLPGDIFRLTKLQILDLHDNRFDGSIPGDIPQNNERLKFLALHQNVLGGTIPSMIANLRHLSHLDLTHNFLTGTIPVQLEKLSNSLTYLFLGGNNYKEGPIPSLVYAMENLRELSLKGSQLTGTISGVIAALDSLLLLDLDDNELTGSIPNEIGALTNLQFLLLNRNQLTSSVPSQALAKLKKLRVLLLDNNHIYGDLNPICGSESLATVYVDCGEVACLDRCCSCCLDGKSCHEYNAIASQDPLWEGEYRRQFFDFSSGKKDIGERFYANRDDDYW